MPGRTFLNCGSIAPPARRWRFATHKGKTRRRGALAGFDMRLSRRYAGGQKKRGRL
jgi:hypothetical protein